VLVARAELLLATSPEDGGVPPSSITMDEIRSDPIILDRYQVDFNAETMRW
jgi:hypothetical protein